MKANIWIAALIVAGAWSGLRAQNSEGSIPQLIPRTAQQRQQEYDQNRRITLTVRVTDKAGKPEKDLSERDFTVLDNGVPRSIVSFRAVDAVTEPEAVHGLVLLDGLNGGAAALRRARREVARFLRGHEPLPFPVTLVVLSEIGLNEGQPSTSRSALLAQLTQLTEHLPVQDCEASIVGADMSSRMANMPSMTTTGSARTDCRGSQFLRSMNWLNQIAVEQQATQGQAVLVWVGPAWRVPQLKESGQIMPNGRTPTYSDIVLDLTKNLREGQVTLDAVSWEDFDQSKDAPQRPATLNIDTATPNQQAEELTPAALTEQTGGNVVEKDRDVSAAIDQCLQNAVTSYSLSFDPAQGRQADEYHGILVKVNRPGAVVRTTASYFAQP